MEVSTYSYTHLYTENNFISSNNDNNIFHNNEFVIPSIVPTIIYDLNQNDNIKLLKVFRYVKNISLIKYDIITYNNIGTNTLLLTRFNSFNNKYIAYYSKPTGNIIYFNNDLYFEVDEYANYYILFENLNVN
jgi:hypothetical protein